MYSRHFSVAFSKNLKISFLGSSYSEFHGDHENVLIFGFGASGRYGKHFKFGTIDFFTPNGIWARQEGQAGQAG